MPVAYPQIITPGQQRLFFGMEGTLGQAPTAYAAATATGTTGPIFLEPVQAITSAIQRDQYEAHEYTGVPADLFDYIETTHHTTITLTVPYRSNGIAAWALACLCGSQQGGATETTTSVTGFTNTAHTITPNNISNVINTMTIWHDQGDGAFTSGAHGMLQMTGGTVESVHLTFAANTAVMAEITMQANFPSWKTGTGSSATAITVPTGYIKLGSDATYDATRMMSYEGVSAFFNIMSSAGTKYTNDIITGDVTITRTNEPIWSLTSQNPYYFLPGPITVAGNFTFLYDGIGNVDAAANTWYEDYLAFQAGGTLAAQNELRFVDPVGNGFDMTFYPIKWTSFTTNASAQSLQATAGFTSYNSLAAAQGSPTRISALRQIVLGNNITYPMIA